jgi:hypothetical protein
MRSLATICVVFIVFSVRLFSQGTSTPSEPAPAFGLGGNWDSADSDRMEAPPSVSGQTYPTGFAAEERSNYLRAGVLFTGAYMDNAFGPVSGYPISDISYSIAPMLALDETTTRLHSILSYAPGFTFYQRESDRNEADQNASITLQYRLSPHVTLSGRDSFQKTSSVFNQPDLTSAAAVSGGTQDANFSIIAPISNLLRNSGNLGFNYQFALNQMIGASGTFSNLHYANEAQVSGLYDSSSQGGSVFYAFRISQMHYLGTTYQYQRLLSYPTGGLSGTQTDAVMFLYTFHPNPLLWFSVVGGPQYSNTVQTVTSSQPQLANIRAWAPSVGGSAGWQGRLTNVALSYSHTISGGAGLIGAVHLDSAAASIRQRITKTLSASLVGMYAQNDVIGSLLLGANNGHTIGGTLSLQQQLGQNWNVQLGYSRLHQDYSEVPVISSTPNTNRESITISYQFSRPLGR